MANLDRRVKHTYNVVSFELGVKTLRVRAKELKRTRKRAEERYKERMKQEATTAKKKK